MYELFSMNPLKKHRATENVSAGWASTILNQMLEGLHLEDKSYNFCANRCTLYDGPPALMDWIDWGLK
jgi:hypothetical protein